MHDLVHELARSVTVEEVAICDANHGSSGAKKDIWRYMFSNFEDGHLKCKDMPLKARAIHFSDCTGYQPSRDAFSVTINGCVSWTCQACKLWSYPGL